MIVLKQTGFGRMRGKRRTKYGLFTRIAGEIAACVRGKTGFKNGAKAGEGDKTAWDRPWPDGD
jgi:hypothetical protein